MLLCAPNLSRIHEEQTTYSFIRINRFICPLSFDWLPTLKLGFHMIATIALILCSCALPGTVSVAIYIDFIIYAMYTFCFICRWVHITSFAFFGLHSFYTDYDFVYCCNLWWEWNKDWLVDSKAVTK